MDWILLNHEIMKYELYIRAVFFGLILSGLAFWEYRATWRKSLLNKRARWTTHVSLGSLSFFLVRFSFPLLPLSMAVIAQQEHFGLLHSSIYNIPLAIKIALSLLGMDFAMYMQHRWMHRYKILWRIHKVHHTDTEVDVTTGLRFHPVEYMMMMAVKLLAIMFLGAPVFAVFIFEVVLSSLTLFNHSNIQLPYVVNKYLRWIFVTPAMHRIHHSDIPFEHNRNFGFCFSLWDRLMNSYLPEAHQGAHHLVFGLETERAASSQTLSKLLRLPFLKNNVKKNKTVKKQMTQIR